MASQAARESRTQRAPDLDFTGGVPTTRDYEVGVDAQPSASCPAGPGPEICW